MAKTAVTTDDLDGSVHATTIPFAFDGRTYEIDLSKKNAAAFQKVLKPYIDAARVARERRSPSAGPGRGRSKRGSSASTVDLAAVRVWAAEAGIAVAERGRIAKSVVEQYEAAR